MLLPDCSAFESLEALPGQPDTSQLRSVPGMILGLCRIYDIEFNYKGYFMGSPTTPLYTTHPLGSPSVNLNQA